MSKDMSAPNWSRTVKRLRRLMAELREHDVQTIEPPNFDTPPGKRYAQGGPVTGMAVIVREDGPRIVVARSVRKL
jgi:hypothetical protein